MSRLLIRGGRQLQGDNSKIIPDSIEQANNE